MKVAVVFSLSTTTGEKESFEYNEYDYCSPLILSIKNDTREDRILDHVILATEY